MNFISRVVTSACGAALLAAWAVALGAQASFPMESLTVPPQRLPSGCRLAPLLGANGEPFVAYPGVRQNPWVGTGTAATSIRQIVDGPPLNSDDPAGPARFTRSAIGVVEAYRAVYMAADRSQVDVYAVRFNDAALTVRASMSRLGEQSRRVHVVGATAVVLLPGIGGDCYRAVADYIASIR